MNIIEKEALESSIGDLLLEINRISETYILKNKLLPQKKEFHRWKVDEFEYTENGITLLQKHGEYFEKKSWDFAFLEIYNSVKKLDEIEQISMLLKNSKCIKNYNDFILNNFILRYIRKYLDFYGTSEINITEIVNGFIKHICAIPLKYTSEVEIDGLIIITDDINFEVDGDEVLLRKTKVEDFEKVSSNDEYNTNTNHISPSAILKIQFTAQNSNDIQLKIRQAISILRLYKVGSIKYILFKTQSESISDIMGSGSVISGNSQSALEKSRINNEDKQRIDKFWGLMKQSIPKVFYDFDNTNLDYKVIAYNRYCDALLQSGAFEKRVASLVMGLESIYLKGSENQELTYRLGIRCAKVFNLLLFDPYEARELIVNAYRFRSLYVHGDQLSRKDENKIIAKYKSTHEFLLKLFDYLRISIILSLLIKLTKDEFINIIDEALFDEAKNKQIEELLYNIRGYI